MTGLAILLVVLSAFAHATWNMLAKRASNPVVFTWWLEASASALLLPVAIWLFVSDPPSAAGWPFVATTVLLHIGYFVWLSRAYRYGDMSVVYPLARGLGLALIPILGVAVLRESMSPLAGLGAALIIVGIAAVSRHAGATRRTMSLSRLLRDGGVRYALLTGLTIGGYSIVDKQGVEHVTPFLYMFFLVFGGMLGMLAIIHRQYPRQAFVEEFKRHRASIVAAGLLQFLAYGLVLSAFRLSPVSYVGPFREIGIVIGVVLGALVLREHVGRVRMAGVGLITAGAVAMALAP